ncbi:urease accessory protein D [Silene latifolia]|uniref:urease accessory protein D n=1 Tax=Silene latifolia TaxID=37657 RepID=UPI003D76F08F
METGAIVVSKIGGKSTVTRCFSKYPLKLIVPNKACGRDVDCAWIYTLTYGGGIVSGDSILCNFIVEDGCTAVLTTQASTKVYKSIGSKCSEQILEARVGHEALLVVIPDPVTCFSAARYSQKQVFRVSSDSNLLLVDWFTSGRYESGERWEFELYRSTNNIYEDDQPLFLDTVFLQQGNISSITERMHDYQIIAMVIILGPKLENLRNQIQENVKRVTSGSFQYKSAPSMPNSKFSPTKPNFIASCSAFGSKGAGLIVRVAAMTTEPVYQFLRLQLGSLEPFVGAFPYS